MARWQRSIIDMAISTHISLATEMALSYLEGKAGVVDEDVDTAVGIAQPLRERLDAVLVGDLEDAEVGLDALVAQRLDRLLATSAVTRAQHHSAPGSEGGLQQSNDLITDALVGSSDDGNLAGHCGCGCGCCCWKVEVGGLGQIQVRDCDDKYQDDR